MPRHDNHVPLHRNAPSRPAFARGLRASALFVGVAVAATGTAVMGGVLTHENAPADTASTVISAAISAANAERLDQPLSADQKRDRANDVSRSDRRNALDGATVVALHQEPARKATRRPDRPRDPRDIARAMLPEFGFSDSEYSCLDALYVSESDWDAKADNPISSAYGIPQALTGGTHELPADYMTNPASQIRWGLGYIRDSYGTPCSAWEFKQANDWY